jgi:hypothetical protein
MHGQPTTPLARIVEISAAMYVSFVALFPFYRLDTLGRTDLMIESHSHAPGNGRRHAASQVKRTTPGTDEDKWEKS